MSSAAFGRDTAAFSRQEAAAFSRDAAEALLRAGLAELGLSADAAPALARYGELVVERNRVLNLTAITDTRGVASLHLLDSAVLLTRYSFPGKRVVDVGTGAGFPGVPLRLLEPSLRLTLLDAQEKRVTFLREAVETLGIPDVSCVHGRAEELARFTGPVRTEELARSAEPTRAAETSRAAVSSPVDAVPESAAWREGFDVVVSRAVAALPMLAELCLPLTAVGGAFLAMKSVNAAEELDSARSAIATLGGEVEHVEDYAVPGADGVRHRLIVIRKRRPTPEKYPRPFAKIRKRPL